jgi:hypothetical protein
MVGTIKSVLIVAAGQLDVGIGSGICAPMKDRLANVTDKLLCSAALS